MKAAREKEQATAREQIEELRLKLQREKNQELQVCCGSLAMSRPSPLLGEGRFSGCVLLPVPPPPVAARSSDEGLQDSAARGAEETR